MSKKKIPLIISLFGFCLVAGFASFFILKKNGFIKTSAECRQKVTCLNCNLLLISADSLRADHVGALGYKRNTTPNFDKLAKQGILYKNYFTASYLTPTTEMSLHTGMYPKTSSFNSFNFATLSTSKNIIISQILKNDNYRTFSMHSSPEFLSFPAVAESFDRGYDEYQLFDSTLRKVQIRSIPLIESFTNLLDKSSSDKFFGWLTLGNMHWPFGKNAKNIFADKNYKGVFYNKDLDWPVFQNVYKGVLYPEKKLLTGFDTQYVNDMYDNGIRQFDDFLGKIVEELNRRGLMKNTVIVISSEHGEDFGEHGYFAHYDIYDTQVHTPLLIIYPKAEGEVISSLVGTVDVLPTILEILGIGIPKQVDGKSTVPIICGDERDKRDTVFVERVPLWEEGVISYELDNRNIPTETGHEDLAIRTNKWKYIRRDSKKVLEKISWWGIITGKKINIPQEELYDIKNDPNEKLNVADKYPQIVNELSKKLLQWEKSLDKSKDSLRQYPKIQDYF